MTDFVLLESGDRLLLETGDRLLLDAFSGTTGGDPLDLQPPWEKGRKASFLRDSFWQTNPDPDLLEDPEYLVTLGPADETASVSWFGTGAYARELFEWSPTESGVYTELQAPQPTSPTPLGEGIEVYLFDTAGGDPFLTSAAVDYAAFAFTYNDIANFPDPDQFVPSTFPFQVDVASVGVTGYPTVETTKTYKVVIVQWYASAWTVDVGPVLWSLYPCGGINGGPYRSAWGGTWQDGSWRGATPADRNPYTGNLGGDRSIAGEQAKAEGSVCVASGYASHAEGRFTTADGAFSHTEGFETSATIDAAAGHAGGDTSEAYWYAARTLASGSPITGAKGSAQTVEVSWYRSGNGILMAQGTNASPFRTNRFYGFRALVVCAKTDGTKAKAFDITGLVESMTATPTLVGSNKTTIADLGASGYDVTVSVSAANGLELTISGSPDRSVATITFTETAVA